MKIGSCKQNVTNEAKNPLLQMDALFSSVPAPEIEAEPEWQRHNAAEVRDLLGEELFRVAMMHVGRGMAKSTIAARLGISRQLVARQIRTIQAMFDAKRRELAAAAGPSLN